MSALSRFLPPLAPDLGGACSLLAPMGGLVVIHDSAGCAENYAVFDERRRPVPVFSSALMRMEAILGDEEALLRKAETAARQLSPRFIALVGSPVPDMLGTDFAALAMELEARCGLPVLGLACGGYRPYDVGLSEALCAMIDRFSLSPAPDGFPLTLGATPLDRPDLPAQCFEDILRARSAKSAVVASYGGLAAAKLLGIPFDLAPAPAFPARGHTLVLGEQVFAVTAAARCGGVAGVVASCDPALGGRHLDSEAKIMSALAEGWDTVVGDPLYRPLVPEGTCFIPHKHPALSSFRKVE
ncbi:MAG TPA: nitrogenase component 1 [Terriglobales bacterium]|nr:nitrogenase component 1 [Terriglobales bacterium]